ncbi:MAG TPA: type VI secretion system contractile sheath large subunit [Gemmatimonadaceae bacterium]|jgi:type VI secretion system protein ImpC|nr:type VI secretion system contractile sheath large subunit [Gemmatimonadaceae bacterium]
MSDEPFRILILGDFGAREHRGSSDAAGIGARRPRRVDRDDLDAAIAAVAPELRLALEPGSAPIVVRVAELEDFHPDHLIERLDDFQRLRDLRAQVATGTDVPPHASSPPRPPTAESTAARLGGGSLLDMILDGDAASPAAAVRPRDELSEYVSQAVRKHAAPQRSVDQETLIQQVDDVIAATMRVVLHHPHFQAAESLWRGVSFLVQRLDTDEMLQVYVVDLAKSELTAAAGAPAEPAGRALRKLLRGELAPGAWSLVVGAYTFAPSETSLIASVAAAAKETGVPWICAAHARFAGVASFAESADPDDWDPSPIPEWEAFRRTADAQWIALTLPRVLLRVPYGARSNECDAIALEETNDGELPHDQFLWGNAAFLCAAMLGEAAGDGSPAPTHGVIEGLPLFVGKVDGLATATPCAEAVLAQRAVVHLLDRGLTVLAGERDGASVRVPRLQSVALPAARLASPSSPNQ